MIELKCKDCGGRVSARQLDSYPPVNQTYCEKCERIITHEREFIEVKEV